MPIPIILPLVLGGLLIISKKKKKTANGKSRVVKTASVVMALKKTNPDVPMPKTEPVSERPGDIPGEGSQPDYSKDLICEFGLRPNRDSTECITARLAPGWVPLHRTYALRASDKWSGPLDTVYRLKQPTFDYTEKYSSGEKSFLITIADGYGISEIYKKKPTKWSNRTKRIIGNAADHPANHAVLGRNSESAIFKYKSSARASRRGWYIKNLEPKKNWKNNPTTFEEFSSAGSSFGWILLPPA